MMQILNNFTKHDKILDSRVDSARIPSLPIATLGFQSQSNLVSSVSEERVRFHFGRLHSLRVKCQDNIQNLQKSVRQKIQNPGFSTHPQVHDLAFVDQFGELLRERRGACRIPKCYIGLRTQCLQLLNSNRQRERKKDFYAPFP